MSSSFGQVTMRVLRWSLRGLTPWQTWSPGRRMKWYWRFLCCVCHQQRHSGTFSLLPDDNFSSHLIKDEVIRDWTRFTSPSSLNATKMTHVIFPLLSFWKKGTQIKQTSLQLSIFSSACRCDVIFICINVCLPREKKTKPSLMLAGVPITYTSRLKCTCMH